MKVASTATRQNGDEHNSQSARRSLWPWFAIGFVVVFIAMLLAVTMYPMRPSGRVVACPLWQYYFLEARRAMNPSRALGPASGSSSAAIATAFEHVLCSSIGGAALLGIGWAVRRFKTRQRKTS
jgi:mannose/fructose/N-acetylgalactosamine-specific phosphotransferase system component IIC